MPQKKNNGGACVLRYTGGGPGDLFGGGAGSVIELELLRDWLAEEHDAGDASLKLIHERFKNAKNSLLLFYDPICPHCRDFQPTYRRLGELLSGGSTSGGGMSGGLPIGAVNVSNMVAGNELLADYMKIKAYPTVMLYNHSGDATSYKLYDGERSLPKLLNFICIEAGVCVPETRINLETTVNVGGKRKRRMHKKPKAKAKAKAHRKSA